MLDGNDLRAEFARYLTEHTHTRWGLDAALMHVCRIAYDAGLTDTTFRDALNDRLKRDAKVEGLLLDAAAGRRPLPTAEECRLWALAIGTPSEYHSKPVCDALTAPTDTGAIERSQVQEPYPTGSEIQERQGPEN